MPITSSAAKALRASKRKRVFNLHRKSELDQVIKNFRKLVTAKDLKGATNLVPNVYQALDKAAKTGYIKKNTADRKKARVMAALKKLV